MTFTVRGWRGRVGLVMPDDGVNDDEFWLYLPEGVTVLMARYATPMRDDPISPDMVDSYASLEVLEAASDILRISRPNVVAFGCNSCSFVRGVGWDLEQAAAIGRVCGVPGTTITTAEVAALQALEVQRIAIAAPYPESVTAKFVDFMRATGFDVVNWTTKGFTTEWQIGNASPAVWYELAKNVDRPEADAVLLGCGGIRTAEVLRALEDDLGKPVVSAPQAMMWHALQLICVDATRQDRGRLFAEFGSPLSRSQPAPEVGQISA